MKDTKMTQYTIRLVKPEDLDQVAAVEAECFPESEAAAKASFRSRIQAFPDSFFVAESNGRIIGFINGCVTDDTVICDEMFADTGLHKPDGAYQAVFGLDVMLQYQKQGIAADLMEHLIEAARRQKRKGLILTCKDKLIHYYERFGFQKLGLSQSVHGGAVWYDMLLSFTGE